MRGDNKDIDAARDALRELKAVSGRNIRPAMRLLNELTKRREDARRPATDDLAELEHRANNALACEYAEDAECLGAEVLALVEELRATRPIVRAAKQLRSPTAKRDTALAVKKRSARQVEEALATIDTTLAMTQDPPRSGSRVFFVKRVFFGVGCGKHGTVSIRTSPESLTGALGGLSPAEVLPEATKHGAVIRVTVELLKPGGETPHPWLQKKRRR